MLCQVKTSGQCQLRDKKNTNIFHCQYTDIVDHPVFKIINKQETYFTKSVFDF
jgi:hypothetical protein